MSRTETEKGLSCLPFCISAYVTSTNILLAKARDVAKPKIKGQELCQSHFKTKAKVKTCEQMLDLPHHLCPKKMGRNSVKPRLV